MAIIPWLIENAHWLVPVAGWISSEILGITSGAEKASVWQVLKDFIMAIPGFIKGLVSK